MCQVFDGRRDLFDERDACACRCPQAQGHVGNRLAHRRAHHLREIICEIYGIGDDVHRAQQCRRDCTQLVDVPAGSHSSTVAGEFALAEPDFLTQFFGGFVLVVAVGEQDRVDERSRMCHHDSADVCEPGAHRGPAVGPQPVDGTLRLRLARCTRRNRPSVCGVDGGGLFGAGDDREVGAVDELVDRGGGSAFRRVELVDRCLHRSRAVDDDGLDPVRWCGRRRDVVCCGDADNRVDRPASLREIGIVVDVNGDTVLFSRTHEILRSGLLRR